MPFGVYVHVPFCAKRCSYCDFNTYTVDAGRDSFAATARAELALLGERTATTVFFGGGTPTLLPPADLAAILDAIPRAPGAEVTVEANPDSVDERSLAALREAGFTRVSFGMQSARPHVLALLGRTHSGGRAVAAAREARSAGFDHVSLDLIYGTPGETDADWRSSLESALAAAPDHMSTYPLAVEPGTRLAGDVRLGRVPAPDEDALARRYVLADELLTGAGFRWYEVASWTTSAEARCRHNMGYWRCEDWVGVGPGAHSHVAGERWWNVKRPAAWAARVAAGESPAAGRERLTPEQRELERLMLGLRTVEGIPDPEAAPADLAPARPAPTPSRAAPARPAPTPSRAAPASTSRASSLVASGLLRRERGRLVLTLRGRLVADLVTRELAAPPRTGRRDARRAPAPAPA